MLLAPWGGDNEKRLPTKKDHRQLRLLIGFVSFAFASLWLIPSAGAATPCEATQGGRIFYVRTNVPTPDGSDPADCDYDPNPGTSPEKAWKTICWAAKWINENGNWGDVVIVGPGVYKEYNINIEKGALQCPSQSPGSDCRPRPISFLGDSSGTCTGDPPGPVVVDADFVTDSTGFIVFGSSDIVISGFEIIHAYDAAVQIIPGRFPDRASERVVVANNVIYGGQKDGIVAREANEPVIFNNLIYGNASTGIGLLSTPNARVINNTLYNHLIGIVIADDPDTGTPPSDTVPSPGAWVINNIIAGSETFGIKVDARSSCDYIGAFNLLAYPDITKHYEMNTPHDRSDIRVPDAGFFKPDDQEHPDFRLLSDSPGLDAGSASASVLGLDGTTARVDGSVDTDQVDLGYHEGNNSIPSFIMPPIATQLVYVSSGGDDGNDGLDPSRPFRTITAAIANARAVTRFIVGPGVYHESVKLPSLRPAGPVEFVADTDGSVMGNAPGLVVVDAGGRSDAINITGHCSTVIDGFAFTDANDNGIFIKAAHRAVLRNNMTFSNGKLGILVVGANDVEIVNNLVYANGNKEQRVGGGIQVTGGDSDGADRALIQNNTVYGNGVDGILIGTAGVKSVGARVRYNILAENGGSGLEVNNNDHAGLSTEGLCVEFNLNIAGNEVPHANERAYGPVKFCDACMDPSSRPGCNGVPCRQTRIGCVMHPQTDLSNLDPEFVEPVAGANMCLGEHWFWDDDFRLDAESPAVDICNSFFPGACSSETAAMAGLEDRTTRTDGAPDMGPLDAGYHYVTEPPENVPPVTGDCDHDGHVSVSELIRGVNIALDRLPMTNCPAFDADDNGWVDVREIAAAVGDSLVCH